LQQETTHSSFQSTLQELAFNKETLSKLRASRDGQKLLDYFDLGCLMIEIRSGAKEPLRIASYFHTHVTENLLLALFALPEYASIDRELHTFLYTVLVDTV
jgi:hypothetical protein